MKKAIYINVMGGTGLNISLTHVLEEAKSVYNKVAVMSPYFDIFECCEFVDVVYKPNEGRDFIFDAKEEDAEIVTTRLYDLNDFIYKRLNYEDAWRQLLHLKPRKNSGKAGEKTYFIDPSKKFSNTVQLKDSIIEHITKKGFEDFILVQFHGGQSPLVQVPTNEEGKLDWDKIPYSVENEPLQRHYPNEKAQEFINLYHNAHPTTAIINYSLPNEPQYENTEQFIAPYLVYSLLSKDDKCKGFVSIDSSLQHLISGNTKGVVIWGHSLPEAFGYECNNNIIQKCRRDDILYMSLLGPSSAKIKYIEPEDLLKEVEETIENNGVSVDSE